jgi:hypothetical protein
VDRLAEMLARGAIEEGLYTYCRSIDRMDRRLAESIWHPEATADYGAFFQGDSKGLLDAIWALHGTLETYAHHVTNKMVEIVAEDRAVAESYTIVVVRVRPDPETFVDQMLSMRYHDRWSTRDGETWKLDERRSSRDLLIQTKRPFSPNFIPSRRDGDDPSYGYFEEKFRG